MTQIDNKPVVLLIGNFLSANGFNKSVSECLAEQLQRRGWRVIVTSTRVNRLARLADMLWTIWRWRHVYQVAQVDVFSGLGFIWAELSTWLLRWLKKPYVLTLHSGNLPVFARRYPTRVRRLLAAAVVTTPSAFLYREMLPYRANLNLLPNPIDLSLYTYRERRAPQPYLIWLRAIHSIYNPTLAVKVVALLKEDFPNVRLTMVGPDKGDGSLELVRNAVEQYGLSSRIRLIGGVPREEVPRWLDQGDIFLNTTNVDNTPISVMEALACGLCVVSTNVGGIPDLLTHEETGLLVEPDDPSAMAGAIRRLLKDAQLAGKLSRQGRAHVERFDQAKILLEWEKLFLNLQSG